MKPPTATRDSLCREVRSEVVENIEISRRFFCELKAPAISDPPGRINGMLERRVSTPHPGCCCDSKFLGPTHFALHCPARMTSKLKYRWRLKSIYSDRVYATRQDQANIKIRTKPSYYRSIPRPEHVPHHHTPPKDVTYDITGRSDQRMRIYCGGLEGRACKSAQRTASHTPATSIGPAFIAFLLISSTYRSSLHPHSNSEARIPVHNNPPCAHLPTSKSAYNVFGHGLDVNPDLGYDIP